MVSQVTGHLHQLHKICYVSVSSQYTPRLIDCIICFISDVTFIPMFKKCVSPIDASQIEARHRKGYLIIICEVYTIVKYLQADMHYFSMQKSVNYKIISRYS
jgi:hypothetical protein